ncbi:unnamed protein product [Closterium sp. NIES-54]
MITGLYTWLHVAVHRSTGWTVQYFSTAFAGRPVNVGYATATATAALAATPATAAPECCATMASLRFLAFDHEGRPVAFDTWHDDLQLYLLSDIKDSVSLFDHVSGVAPAPPATADGATRSQWLSPDLATHLRTSDARYRATVPAEFLATNQPPMFITLYFIVFRLPNSLRSVRDHFLSLGPTSLTVDLLEQHLLAAETSAVAVGAARGTPRSPFFEGCSPSPLSPSFASSAAADVSVTEDVGAASTSAKRRSSKGKGGRGGGGGSGGGGGGSGSGGGGSGGGGGGSGGGGGGGTGGRSGGSGGGGGGSGGSCGSGGRGTGGGRSGPRRGGPGGGQRQHQQRRSETQSPQQLREWLVQHGTGGGSETCPYVIRTGVRAGQTCGKFHNEHRCFSRLDDAWRAEFGDDVERPRWTDMLRAEGDYYQCVPPGPAIAAAALGASASGTPPDTAPAEALHTFTLGLRHLALFLSSSTPLVLYELGEYRCPPGCDGHYHHSRGPACVDLHTYTNRASPGYVHSLARVESVHTSKRASSGRCVCSGLCLPSHPHLPRPPCLPCVEGRQRAAPHSSSFPLTTAPLQTLHMDVWGPARVSGQGREHYFLLLVDDYTRYTTVFPLRSKGEVPDVLIPWIRTVHLQLRERFGTDLLVLYLHSDRGGEFSSDLLRDFSRGEGTLQSFTLSESPQKNGIAERRIGLVMEVARTSMVHSVAPHFLWPFAVRYAAHQLNLWPRVSLPETSPTLRWTGKVGDEPSHVINKPLETLQLRDVRRGIPRFHRVQFLWVDFDSSLGNNVPQKL